MCVNIFQQTTETQQIVPQN